jgi:hypothetical protein
MQERFRFYSYGDCMLVLPDEASAAAGPRRGPLE